MKKTAEWYYKEFDRVEAELKAATHPTEVKKLQQYLDKLHDEFWEIPK
jgi:hypothetical protein